MSSEEAVKRRYQSPLREAQARSTRMAVLEAAARLFVERGYVGTSIDAVAEAAGVSRATVFTSVGGKGALLKGAYDIAVVGDDEPVPLPERPWAQPVREEPDPARMLTLYAGLLRSVGARVAEIYEAVRGAASADPDARDLWEWILSERRKGAGNVVALLASKGPLREGLEAEVAADLVWVLNDPGLYHLLVTRRRWTPQRFEEWLAETLRAQLLPPSGHAARSP